MRKLIVVLCVFSLVLSIPVSCKAETVYSIDEYGFSVSIPVGMIVFTPGMSKSAAIWEEYDLDADQFLQEMKDNDVVLRAIEPDFSGGIVISACEEDANDGIFNLSLYDDEDISLGKIKDSLETDELEVTDLRLYQSGDYKFFLLTGTETIDDKIHYEKTYVTFVNGIMVNATLHSTTREGRKENEGRIKAVADSIKFDEIKSMPVPENTSQAQDDLGNLYISLAFVAALAMLSVLVSLLKNKPREASLSGSSMSHGEKHQDSAIDYDDIQDVLSEEKQRRADESYQKLIQAKKKWRVGQLMLSYGKHDQEVIENARQLNMTADEFLSLCQEWVDEYNDLYREYKQRNT